MKKPCEVIKLLNSKTVQELSDTDFRAMCLRAPELSDAVNKVLYNEKVRREYKKRAQPYIQKIWRHYSFNSTRGSRIYSL